jgi:putative MFS transporter
MPTFAWNLAMCFLMGVSAGGLLPVAFTLLAEIAPARDRGWLMVLLGGVGTVGGYLAASGCAAWLEPRFGWRVLWFLGLPTGLILLVLNRFIPESPRFFLAQGRCDDAERELARFGLRGSLRTHLPQAVTSSPHQFAASQLFRCPYGRWTLGLNLCALSWGLVNFGFLLWLPTSLQNAGWEHSTVALMLSKSAILAFPGILLVAWLYHTWSTKKSLITLLGLTAVAMAVLALPRELLLHSAPMLTLLIVVLLVTSGGIIAVLLPYTAELYPIGVRSTALGMVAGASKFGGLAAQGLSLLGISSGSTGPTVLITLTLLLSVVILLRHGVETRGQSLELIGPESSRPRTPRVV